MAIIKKFSEFKTLNESVELIDTAKRGKVANLKNMLKRKDVDVNFTNRYGNTALTTSVFFKKLNSIKALVEAGADVNKKGGDQSPLDIAEQGGDKAIIDYLKSKGAE